MEQSVIQYQMLTVKILQIIVLALLVAEKVVLFYTFSLYLKAQDLSLGGFAIL
jgi:hypothetical protein